MKQPGFFDLFDRMEKLSEKDPLIKLDQEINWAIFRPALKKALRKERKSNAGCIPFEYLKMFKGLLLQRLYRLSDEQLEFQLRDRLTFARFVGFTDEEGIPDANTFWLFKENLAKANAIEELFELFDRHLHTHGYFAKKGQIVDASIVEVPVQRNTEAENKAIKTGETPPDWPENQAKLCQKDTEARWTKKNGKKYFGYKNHVNVDVKHKFVRKYKVTSAEVHDSQVFDDLLDPYNSNPSVWADSAYRSEKTEEQLKELGYRSRIHAKAHRNSPLSVFQQKLNRQKSKIRARVEHVFGFQQVMMWSGMIRGIGKVRATAKIGLANLTYNIWRFAYLQRLKTA